MAERVEITSLQVRRLVADELTPDNSLIQALNCLLVETPAGRVLVEPDLTIPGHPEVFVIGDAAYLVPEGETSPIPPRAQAAHQQSSHLVRQIQRRMHGETKLAPCVRMPASM